MLYETFLMLRHFRGVTVETDELLVRVSIKEVADGLSISSVLS